MLNLQNIIIDINNLTWQERLHFIAKNYQNITFSTSFSIEDQIICDEIFQNNLNIEVFAIDTGRLPSATYKLWQETLDKYQKTIKAFYPDAQKITDFVENDGINSFYNSLELRHKCCHIRKVEPLKKALKNKEIWISGVRKEHNLNRKDKNLLEFDESLDIIKFYPILDLNEDEIWGYIKKNNIPYNKLYNEGYKSIGCDPCSRAVKDGEDARSGRWWWESDNKQECGLHMVNGKLVRSNNKDK